MGLVVWFTGLTSSGKSTIAEATRDRLSSDGLEVELLDGDAVRKSLSKGLGFSKEDRNENIRRITFVASLLARHGVIVLVAAVSPFRNTREQARKICEHFLEVYVNAPLPVCEKRDLKGLYKKARRGEVSNIAGLDDPYELPLNADVECRTDLETVSESVTRVLQAISSRLLKNPKMDRF